MNNVYSFALKEVVYLKTEKGDIKPVRIVEYDSVPEYHIANNIVYVLVTAYNVVGESQGLLLYLPIAAGVDEFLKRIGK